jgi:hypothetical protein
VGFFVRAIALVWIGLFLLCIMYVGRAISRRTVPPWKEQFIILFTVASCGSFFWYGYGDVLTFPIVVITMATFIIWGVISANSWVMAKLGKYPYTDKWSDEEEEKFWSKHPKDRENGPVE